MIPSTGLVEVASKYGFSETLERLASAFSRKGMKIFSLIDHSGEAEKWV
jgi:uncharacterized protein (DUF302 family)